MCQGRSAGDTRTDVGGIHHLVEERDALHLLRPALAAEWRVRVGERERERGREGRGAGIKGERERERERWIEIGEGN